MFRFLQVLCLLVAASEASVRPAEKDLAKVSKRLTLDSMHKGLRDMEYAVRGSVVIKADEISMKLKKGEGNYPFDHIVYTNIGNPHSVGQKPLTWPRQVLALVDLPEESGVDHPVASQLFPADAIRRAREIKACLAHGTGAYSHSKGVECLRKDVARFIKQRDGGVPCNVDDLFLTNGASAGITMILNALIANPRCGVMIPIPQYPLYSATIDMFQGQQVGYYLDEEKGWELNMAELERAYNEATAKGIIVTSMVVINPGNPSGSVLSRDNLHDIVRFCAEKRIVLLADEVYQENVYDDRHEFVSCKRAAFETGLLDDDELELVSFHSTSKGVMGECGRRGGYMELVGLDPDVKAMLYKLASSSLCSTVSGQIMTSLMVRGPEPADESYESHEAEKKAILESLRRRSLLVSKGLNSIPGFSCQTATGSMYCFPSIKMPQGAIMAAHDQGLSPDTLYAISLLEHTGICVVPASGFRQKEGRYGFRTTFLPKEKDLEMAVKKIEEHYKAFCSQYS